MSFIVLVSSLLAFAAGVCVTALAVLLRRKKKITCQHCARRHLPECPLSHLEQVDGAELFYRRKTNCPDDFYCKEALPYEPKKL